MTFKTIKANTWVIALMLGTMLIPSALAYTEETLPSGICVNNNGESCVIAVDLQWISDEPLGTRWGPPPGNGYLTAGGFNDDCDLNDVPEDVCHTHIGTTFSCGVQAEAKTVYLTYQVREKTHNPC